MQRLRLLYICCFVIAVIGTAGETVWAQNTQQMFWALNKCPLLLSQISTKASAAYSLRKINCNYTGFAIQVRKTGGAGGTQDIGFTTGGGLDTAALKSFVGSNNAFITIWYDQSGNGKNFTQTTNADQPRIISAGKIDRENGKPAITFQDVSDVMTAAAMNIQSFSAVRRAFSSTTAGDMQYLVSTPANTDFSIRSSSSTAFTYGDGNGDDFWNTGAIYVGNVATRTYANVLHCLYAYTGTALSSSTLSLSSTFSSRGMYNGDPVSELIVFPSVLTDRERTIVYTNQKIYYATP